MVTANYGRFTPLASQDVSPPESFAVLSLLDVSPTKKIADDGEDERTWRRRFCRRPQLFLVGETSGSDETSWVPNVKGRNVLIRYCSGLICSLAALYWCSFCIVHSNHRLFWRALIMAQLNSFCATLSHNYSVSLELQIFSEKNYISSEINLLSPDVFFVQVQNAPFLVWLWAPAPNPVENLTTLPLQTPNQMERGKPSHLSPRRIEHLHLGAFGASLRPSIATCVYGM